MQNTMCDNIVSFNSQELSNASASSALKLFENPQFKIRVIMRCAEPWFVAKDVATCIEHSNVTKMCDLCRDKDKVVIGMDEIATNNLLVANMTRELTCISESGLYRILAKCNLPKCEPFECDYKSKKRRWNLHPIASSGSLLNGSTDAKITDIPIRRNYVGQII